MGRMQQYLAMKTDPVAQELISSDINELKLAVLKLIDDATKLGGLGFGTSFLKWVASFSAIYLLILDRTNWRTNMLTSLLVPYIFFLQDCSTFSDWLEMSGSLILLLVVAPSFFAVTLKGNWVPATRTHPSIRWIPEFLHSESRHIEHRRHYTSVSVPNLVACAPLCLADSQIDSVLNHECHCKNLNKNFCCF